MKRVGKILNDPGYISNLERIEALEDKRIFCKHGAGHSLDVARIACILNIEEMLGYDKEIIYTAAILHDIGRGQGERHEHGQTSADAALLFLREYGYSQEEISLIIDAIKSHSGQQKAKGDGLSSFSDLIFRADKLSRLCFICKSRQECDWPEERKNKELIL